MNRSKRTCKSHIKEKHHVRIRTAATRTVAESNATQPAAATSGTEEAVTDAIKIALITTTPPTIVALGAFVLGWMNRSKLTQVHLDMNGRLTQLLQSREQEGHSQGMRDQAAQDANSGAAHQSGSTAPSKPFQPIRDSGGEEQGS